MESFGIPTNMWRFYLADTVGFVNDKTCQEFPVVEVLQGGHQPAAGTHLGHSTRGNGK